MDREIRKSGLNLILAQSLIKKLCERCKMIDPHPNEMYDGPVFKAVGCPDCFNKGTRGRTAMAELLYFNEEVKEWVEDRALTARDVVNRATRAGYLIPMQEVARQKVIAGITSEMEVAAVLGLVESKRQFTNQESDRRTNEDHARSLQEAIDRHEAVGKA
jgi:type II secretory ATPase GspE/PulE/Tfp pilus assembly ATPase PilB-like protein